MSDYYSSIQNPEVVDVRRVRVSAIATDITAVATAVVAARNAHNQGAVERVLDLLQQVAFAASEV